MSNDTPTTQADATIHAIDKIYDTNQNRERINQLEERVSDLEERNEELEGYIRQLAARRLDQSSESIDIENLEESDELNDAEDTQENTELCPYCGDEYNVRGISTHKKSCDERDDEEQGDEVSEEESDDQPFFKQVRPSEISMNLRRSAIRGYLKQVRENEGKFEVRTVKEIAQDVFGCGPIGSSDPDYQAVYKAVYDEPSIRKGGEKKRSDGTTVQTYKMSNKVKA